MERFEELNEHYVLCHFWKLKCKTDTKVIENSLDEKLLGLHHSCCQPLGAHGGLGDDAEVAHIVWRCHGPFWTHSGLVNENSEKQVYYCMSVRLSYKLKLRDLKCNEIFLKNWNNIEIFIKILEIEI